MKTGKRFSIGRWLVLSSLWLWAASQAQVGRTLVLDDFESPDSTKKWEAVVARRAFRPGASGTRALSDQRDETTAGLAQL